MILLSITPFCSSNSSGSKCSLYAVPCRLSQIRIRVPIFLSFFSVSLWGSTRRRACLHQAPRQDSAIFRLALKSTRELQLLPFAANSPYRQFNLTFLFLLTIHKFHQNTTLSRLPTISLAPFGLYQFMTFSMSFIRFSHSQTSSFSRSPH